MPTTRRRRPEVEALEGRALPSAGPGFALPVPAFLAHHGHRHRPHHHHHHHHRPHPSAGATQQLVLSGEVLCTAGTVPTLPDGSSTLPLTGTGTVAPVGDVFVSGELRTPGFVTGGAAEGALTLTGANGSLALQLMGPFQFGSGPPPGTFQYTISGGTGAFAGASGRGTVIVQGQGGPGGTLTMIF
jgi:hypothetical protein